MATVAILVHGAGSCPETARRLLAPAVPAGATVVALDARGPVERVIEAIDAAAVAAGERLTLVAGISLGAHASALWAATTGSIVDLVLAMPAWIGPPGPVAALTAAAADDVEVHGVTTVLDRLRDDPLTRGDWVLDELARGWTSCSAQDLVVALRDAAASRAPTVSELGAIRAPTAVVALADDPLHPEAVARRWAGAIGSSTVDVVGRHAPLVDRGSLGRAGRRGLDRLSGSR